MTDNTSNQSEALKPYAVQPSFYTGVVTSVSAYGNYAYSTIDGIPNQTVYCIKTSMSSLNRNSRVVLMEIGGTYLIIARIT